MLLTIPAAPRPLVTSATSLGPPREGARLRATVPGGCWGWGPRSSRVTPSAGWSWGLKQLPSCGPCRAQGQPTAPSSGPADRRAHVLLPTLPCCGLHRGGRKPSGGARAGGSPRVQDVGPWHWDGSSQCFHEQGLPGAWAAGRAEEPRGAPRSQRRWLQERWQVSLPSCQLWALGPSAPHPASGDRPQAGSSGLHPASQADGP